MLLTKSQNTVQETGPYSYCLTFVNDDKRDFLRDPTKAVIILRSIQHKISKFQRIVKDQKQGFTTQLSFSALEKVYVSSHPFTSHSKQTLKASNNKNINDEQQNARMDEKSLYTRRAHNFLII